MNMIGESAVFRRVITQAERFAATRISVLLVGETGTGKELLARYIHDRSGRRGQFVDLNCGAVPREIIESLLFGHRRGAFTGAVEDSVGLVTLADGGTLFLDELPSLPIEGQAKLLRVLETRELRRVGDIDKRSVDFRVVAAVQDDFGSRVEAGLFRRDLYHRLAGVHIVLPPLRERPEDIEILASHFAVALHRTLGADALTLLRRYHWPGNIRELRAVVECAAILTDEPVIQAAEVIEAFGRRSQDIRTTPMRAQLVQVCAANGWDPTRIARALGVSRATLYRRLRAHGVRLRGGPKSRDVAACLETT